VKCKLRHKAAFYNADIACLFTIRGLTHLAKIAMSPADRFECQALQDQLLWKRGIIRIRIQGHPDPHSAVVQPCTPLPIAENRDSSPDAIRTPCCVF
jgi:hypothetical protein